MNVDIVTPLKKLAENIPAENLRLPAQEGEITVLDGHTELLTLLTTGVLSFAEGGKERKFVVSYGFAEIRGNRAVVLAETCEEASQIDLERAKAAQSKASEALKAQMTREDFSKHELKLRRANLRVQLASSK